MPTTALNTEPCLAQDDGAAEPGGHPAGAVAAAEDDQGAAHGGRRGPGALEHALVQGRPHRLRGGAGLQQEPEAVDGDAASVGAAPKADLRFMCVVLQHI